MAWLRRAGLLACAAVLATAALVVGQTEPPQAQANVPCDVATGVIGGGVGVITGAVGVGNPVGDACDAVTGPVVDPVEDAVGEAAGAVGGAVFGQITSWATDGAVWLLGEIVELTDRTTTPDLLSAGFIRQYRQMASIAVVLALAMLLLAAVEGLGRGDPGMLWRVFLVNAPVAALATSAAYVVVQLLVATSDGFCEVITHTAGHDTREFFKSAIDGLSAAGGKVGKAAGEAEAGPAPGAKAIGGAASGTAASVEVPLFVSFIAAMVAAFAAFLVWIELLMRSAAIYAVALFMPLAIAASIWPRWSSALKRTCELVVVVVFSKFVVVAIIGLAASLLANTGGEIEHVLSAGALLLLACFSPVVLLKLVPFAEGAATAAFSRQSAGSAAVRSVEHASSVSMLRRTAFSNWGASPEGGASAGGGGGKDGAGASGTRAGSRGGGGEAATAGEGGVATMPVAAGVAAAKTAKAEGERLGQTGIAEAASEAPQGAPGGGGGGQLEMFSRAGGEASGSSAERPPGAVAGGDAEGGREAPAPSSAPSPAGAEGGSAPGVGHKAPRPGGEPGGRAEGAPPKSAAAEEPAP